MNLPTWKRTETTQTWRDELPGGARGDEYSKTIVSYQCDDPAQEVFLQKCATERVSLPRLDAWIAKRPEGHPWRAEVIAARACALADPRCLRELRVVFGFARLQEFAPGWLADMPESRARERAQDRWGDFKHAMSQQPVDWQRADGYLEALNEAVEAADEAADARPAIARNSAWQAGTSKPRPKRKPLLDAWIGKADLSQSNADLWSEFPVYDAYDDDGDEDALFVDEDGRLVERSWKTGLEQSISRGQFNNRLADARTRKRNQP